MTIIEKVSCFPNEGAPEVIAGDPQLGDLVRIITPTGAVIYERYTPPAIPSPPQPKKSGLSGDEFHALFTQQELIDIYSAHVDEYMNERGLTPLTILQKGQLVYLLNEAKETGLGRGISLASPKMGPALDFLISLAVISSNRKAEILAGTIKS